MPEFEKTIKGYKTKTTHMSNDEYSDLDVVADMDDSYEKEYVEDADRVGGDYNYSKQPKPPFTGVFKATEGPGSGDNDPTGQSGYGYKAKPNAPGGDKQ